MLMMLAHRYSTHLEVFSLNNFWVAAGVLCSCHFVERASFHRRTELPAMAQALSDQATPPHMRRLVLHAASWADERAARTAALLCGVGMCNQHTLALYALPSGLWVALEVAQARWMLVSLVSARRHVLSRLVVALWLWLACMTRLLGVAIVGLLPYAYAGCVVARVVAWPLNSAVLCPNHRYLPWSSTVKQHQGSWGDCATFIGFARHLLRVDYGTFRLHASDEARTTDTLDRIQL